MPNCSKRLGLNPKLWDIIKLEKEFKECGIEFSKTNNGPLEIEYHFPKQKDAKNAFYIIYAGVKPGIWK